MSLKDWALIIELLSTPVYITYVFTAAFLHSTKSLHGGDLPDTAVVRRARYVWRVLKYLTLVFVCVQPGLWIISRGSLTFWHYLLEALNLFTWYVFRDVDDDDDWKKKLKEKVSGAVKVFHGKLVVVPQAA